MKIYLAARYIHHPWLRDVAAELTAMGHEVTSRWIQGGHELSKEGSAAAAEADRRRFAMEDVEDLRAADCCLSFTEAPRSTNSRGGRHVEFGLALGLGKRVIVVGHRENVFHCLPEVEYCATWADAKRVLSEGTARLEPADFFQTMPACPECGEPKLEHEGRRFCDCGWSA